MTSIGVPASGKIIGHQVVKVQKRGHFLKLHLFVVAGPCVRQSGGLESSLRSLCFIFKHTSRASDRQVEMAIGASLSVQDLFEVSWDIGQSWLHAYLTTFLKQKNKILGLIFICTQERSACTLFWPAQISHFTFRVFPIDIEACRTVS